MAVRRGLGKGLDSLIPLNKPAEEKKPEPAAKKPAAKEKTAAKEPAKKVKTAADEKPAAKKDAPAKKAAAPKKKEAPKPKKQETVKEDVIEEKKPVEMPEIQASDTLSVVLIPIDKIEPNRNQPRKTFKKKELNELALSIRQHGVLNPLTVQKKDDYYAIIAGERRWRAAGIAGLTEVPVIIKDYTDREALEIALIENIQREDLNPIEEAEAYQNLIKELGLTQKEAADRVGKERETVANSIRLLALDDHTKELLISEKLTAGHARALLRISDEKARAELADKIVSRGLSVRETERIVKEKIEGKPSAKTAVQLPSQVKLAYRKAEEKLKSITGTKVSIISKDAKQGKIEFEYYSPDELERLLELFNTLD